MYRLIAFSLFLTFSNIANVYSESAQQILQTIIEKQKELPPLILNIKVHNFIPSEGNNGSKYEVVVRQDGSRYDVEGNTYQILDDETTKMKMNFRRIYQNGQYFAKTVRNPLEGGNIEGRIIREERPLGWRCYAPYLYGYFGSSMLTYTELLLGSENLKVRSEKETIDGFPCYVIEGDTPDGHYTVWIDPNSGYNYRQALVEQSFDPLLQSEYGKNVTSIQDLTTGITIDSIDGIFMITKGTRITTDTYADGSTDTSKSEAERYVIQFNPDFEALGAFKMDMPNGTIVTDSELQIDYVWRDGRVVDSWGRAMDPNNIGPILLIGKVLPDISEVGVELENSENKVILICFFDYQQRPSRNCIMQLAKQAEELKEKDISIVVIQASKIEQDTLDKWVKDQNISFPVGMIETDEEQTKFNWGVQSLPWLILTDTEHVVTAEGFSINELEGKVKDIKTVE